jgi:RNA polymerase sigma-70 factor (ECF subfamily)
MSPETSTSLLDRLRNREDAESWQVLLELYTPMIRGWLRRNSGLDQDADDVIQDVLSVVVRRIPEFHREPRAGAFRAWLKAITINCLRDTWKARRKHRPNATADSRVAELVQQLEDPHSGLSKLWDQEHDQHVTRRLLDLIRPQFTAKTWQAFQRFALQSEPAESVAADLQITVNAVFIAKSRVLSALRREGAGLLED